MNVGQLYYKCICFYRQPPSSNNSAPLSRQHSHDPKYGYDQSQTQDKQQPANQNTDPIAEHWSGVKSAEIYGTLPKKGKNHYSNIGNQPSVYQTFMDKQRAGAANTVDDNESNPSSNEYSSKRQIDELLQHRRRCDSESSVVAACEEEVIGSTHQGTVGYNRIQHEHGTNSVFSYHSQRSSTSSSASASTSSTLDGRKVDSDTYTKRVQSDNNEGRSGRKDTRQTNHSRDSSCSSSHTLTAHSRENSLNSVLNSNKVRRSTTPIHTQTTITPTQTTHTPTQATPVHTHHYTKNNEYGEPIEYVSCQRKTYPTHLQQHHPQSQSQKPWYGDDEDFPPPPPPITDVEHEQNYGQFDHRAGIKPKHRHEINLTIT